MKKPPERQQPHPCQRLLHSLPARPQQKRMQRRRPAQALREPAAQGALRQNLHNLMDGSVSPRHFVQEFFQLTEAGNMRNDIRKKLVISLLMSETVRPSVKFLMLENFHQMPAPVQTAIIQALLRADSSRHEDLMKEELRWIVAQGVEYDRAH